MALAYQADSSPVRTALWAIRWNCDCPKGEAMKYGMVLAALGLMLTGCATQQAAINAGEAAALVGIKAANDNAIHIWVAAACGTPLSAAIRNPEIIPALKVLCLPAGAESSPITLLDAIK
jgi:hypothetical protein